MDNFIELMESNLAHKDGLRFIEMKIRLLFTGIANTNKIDDTQSLFKSLEDIQFVIARSMFKSGTEVTPFLRKFVYDFDRIDDKKTKEYLYIRIKSGEMY